jgi:two-component system, OmpR family, response regulator
VHVLIVEDEPRMAALLERGLSREGLTVDVVGTGAEALARASSRGHDVIVLDVMLPDMSGFDTCHELRRSGVRAGVLMLTARESVEDRVLGLDRGADDYLVKPFAFAELLARLRALGRRTEREPPAVLEVGALRLDTVAHRAWSGPTEVALSAKEFALLELFMRRPGDVLTREDLLEHAWGAGYTSRSNVVDVYIRRLRARLDEPPGRSALQTVRGVGYRLHA